MGELGLCRLVRFSGRRSPLRKAPKGEEDRHERLAESGPREVGVQVPCCDIAKYCQSIERRPSMDEAAIRKYIQEQEKHQRDQDQGELKFD